MNPAVTRFIGSHILYMCYALICQTEDGSKMEAEIRLRGLNYVIFNINPKQ